MSTKKFDKFFVANLKRTAQMVSPSVREKQKLQKEIDEHEARIAELDAQIAVLDGQIKKITGGFGVEDLVVRNIIDTGKIDKDGKPIKVTKWELKYPQTIIPDWNVPMEQEDIISNDESINNEPNNTIE